MCLINKNVLKMIKYLEYGSQFGSSFTLGARFFFYRKYYCIKNLGCSAGLSLILSLVLKNFRLTSLILFCASYGPLVFFFNKSLVFTIFPYLNQFYEIKLFSKLIHIWRNYNYYFINFMHRNARPKMSSFIIFAVKYF